MAECIRLNQVARDCFFWTFCWHLNWINNLKSHFSRTTYTTNLLLVMSIFHKISTWVLSKFNSKKMVFTWKRGLFHIIFGVGRIEKKKQKVEPWSSETDDLQVHKWLTSTGQIFIPPLSTCSRSKNNSPKSKEMVGN